MRRIVTWFFRPSSPRAIAVVRIVTNGWTLWYLAKRWRLITRTASGSPRDFDPVGIARPLRRPLPPRVIAATTAANYTTLALAGLGVAHRITGPLNAALTWWTLTYRNSWSMVFHNDNLAVLHLTALGVAPSADALSVDALVRHRFRTATPQPSWQYGWPLQTINAVTAGVYLVCGLAKLTGPLGRQWATGQHLRSQVAVDGIRKAALRPDADRKASPFVEFIERRPWMWNVFAAGSLAAELGAPIALVHPRLGRAWSIGAWGMHAGIKATMQITFRYQLSGIAYTAFALAPKAA